MQRIDTEIKTHLPDPDNALARPLVSVLVVVRNGCADIAGVIDSIREQVYRPLEVLVVDGMSDDGTGALVEEQVAGGSDFSIRLLDDPDRIRPAAGMWVFAQRTAIMFFVSMLCTVVCSPTTFIVVWKSSWNYTRPIPRWPLLEAAGYPWPERRAAGPRRLLWLNPADLAWEAPVTVLIRRLAPKTPWEFHFTIAEYSFR